LEHFPDVYIDNHFNGIGLHAVYDSKFERFIITKLDYEPVSDDITYEDYKFYVTRDGLKEELQLTDLDYFYNRSWTASFNFNTKSWISFHSYLPNFYIAENNFFYSGLNNCCGDFDFIVAEIPELLDCYMNGYATNCDHRLPDCFLEGEAVELCPTTTTTTIEPCYLDGQAYEICTYCELEGEASEVCGPTTTTTTNECIRPSNLNTYELITGYTIGGQTYNSTGDPLSACEAMYYLKENTNIQGNFIIAQTTGVTIGAHLYLGNGTDDCQCVPDGWYFTGETSYNEYVFHVEDCIIDRIFRCGDPSIVTPSTTTTTTTDCPINAYLVEVECEDVTTTTTTTLYVCNINYSIDELDFVPSTTTTTTIESTITTSTTTVEPTTTTTTTPEPPIAENITVAVNRDVEVCEVTETETPLYSWFPFTDATGSSLQSIRIVSIPEFGNITVDGNPVLAGDVINVPYTTLNYHSDAETYRAYLDVVEFQVNTGHGWSDTAYLTFDVGTCFSEVGECLDGLIIETIYLRATTDQELLLDEYEHSCMNAGHICNGALYEVYGNNVYLGDSRMNNNNGIGGIQTPYGTYICEDYNNTPDEISKTGVWTGDPTSRYSKIVLTQQQAMDAANAAGGGTVIDFELLAAMDTYNEPSCRSGGAHRDITWTRISANDGTVFYNGCPEGFFVSIDVCNPPAWQKIAEFETRSPASTTFDPQITGTGEFKWIIEETEYAGGSMSVTLDGQSHIVELWAFGVTQIQTINMTTDHLIGVVDLSNDAFKKLTSINIAVNTGVTGLILPAELDNEVTNITINNTGIVGILDLSAVKKVSNFIFYAYSNPSLTGITLAPVITGNLNLFSAHTSNITGTVDLSVFESYGSLTVQLNGNQFLNNIVFKNTPSLLNVLQAQGCNLIGEIDLSMFTSFSTNTSINLSANYSLTNLKLATVIESGVLSSLSLYSTGIINLDLSMIERFGAASFLSLYLMNNLETVLFTDNMTEGKIYQLMIYSNPKITSLDLSGFHTIHTSNTYWYIRNNQLLSYINMSQEITEGQFYQVQMYSNASGVQINVPETGPYTNRNDISLRFYGNSMTAAQVNKILALINNVSVAGYTGRQILIHANTCPDGGSGGYDGITARNELIAKGFTVQVDTGCPTSTTTTTTTIV
jgi:hypothetical protein